MDRLINLNLLKNPANWVIVLALAVIAAVLFREMFRLFEVGEAAASGRQSTS